MVWIQQFKNIVGQKDRKYPTPGSRCSLSGTAHVGHVQGLEFNFQYYVNSLMIPLLVQVLHEKKQNQLFFSPEEIYLNFQDKYRLKNQLGKHHISKRNLRKDRHGITELVVYKVLCLACSQFRFILEHHAYFPWTSRSDNWG